MQGKHIIIDIHNIEEYELLFYISTIKKLIEQIVDVGNLNVVGVLKHQFSPIGATMIYLLSESHLSIHTYPEMHYCAIDLYCCNPDINFNPILDVIHKFFGFKCWISHKIITRC